MTKVLTPQFEIEFANPFLDLLVFGSGLKPGLERGERSGIDRITRLESDLMHDQAGCKHQGKSTRDTRGRLPMRPQRRFTGERQRWQRRIHISLLPRRAGSKTPGRPPHKVK